MKALLPALLLVCGLTSALAGAATPGTVEPTFSAGNRFSEQDGASLYRNICQGCHMPDAKGARGSGTYPALEKNPKLAARAFAAHLVLHGGGAMPEFGSMLDDSQVAQVVNYLRAHFGNHYRDLIRPDEVRSLRAPSG